MKTNKKLFILLLLLIIVLGFNSVSASDSNDLIADSASDLDMIEDSSADLSLSSDMVLDSDSDSDHNPKAIASSEIIDDEMSESISDVLEDDSISDSNVLKDDSDSIYVSLNGNDDNDGSNQNPVRTVERGIQLATAEGGSHKVFVMEGNYIVFNVDIDYTYVSIEGSGIDKTIFNGMEYTGGMFSIFNSSVSIKNLSLIDAVSTDYSGGAFTNMGNLTIENLKVSGCKVKNANGAVIYSVGNLNIINSSFSNNEVLPSTYGGNGGVIYADGYSTTLSCPPSLNITGCEFINNTANGNTFGGGAIYMQYVDGFKSIENTKFINNKALSGGAIFMQNSLGNFLMNNVSFIKNTATGTVTNYGGGAINLVGKTDGRVGNVIIKNSQFINNSAVKTRGGGAILDRNVDLNITNSIIYNNRDTEMNMSIYKDTTQYYPSGGRIFLEDNWWGSNNPSRLDKLSINRWVVLNSYAELSDSLDNYISNPDSDKNFDYNIKLLLNQYNDGTSIEDENYYPFEAQFNIISANGVLNQTKGTFVNNIADVLLSSPSRGNTITVRVDGQSLQFKTDGIISNISSEKLQEIIDYATDGDTIDLGNCNCENISGIIINKSLSIIGNNATVIKSAGNHESGNAIFAVDKNSFDVNSLNVSNVKFLVDNGDIVILVNASNSTDPLEINVPVINIRGVTVDKLDEGVAGKSVSLLEISSQRGLLATSNPINIENVTLFEGVKPFKFSVNGIETENGIDIPKGGNIDINDSNNNPIVKLATSILAKGMKTTAVNTKINGKKAGKTFSITLKDSKGNALANKEVLISFNAKIYKVKTNAKGIASIKVALAKKGTYPVVVSFLGDEKYNGSFAVANVKVNPQKVKLTVAKKKYKLKSKKILTATLKATNKKAINGKSLTFIVSKKKYTAKTNKKGIAKVKVKLSKRKTYKFTVKFAGDNTFKKISKKGKVVIR